jgi:hypothetical protein
MPTTIANIFLALAGHAHCVVCNPMFTSPSLNALRFAAGNRYELGMRCRQLLTPGSESRRQ